MRRVLLDYRCNNGCIFCPQAGLRAAESSEIDDARLVLEREVTPGDVVAILGGEPTMSPVLVELVRLARSRGAADVIVQTNGRRLAYPSYASALFEAGVSAVDVSLHGSTAPMHESHTRTLGSFAQTVQGLGAAMSVGLRVGVTVVVTRSNVRHLAEIVRLVHARGVRRIHFAELVTEGAARENSPRLTFAPEIAALYTAEARRVARSLRVEIVTAPDDGIPQPIFAGIGALPPVGSRSISATIDQEASLA